MNYYSLIWCAFALLFCAAIGATWLMLLIYAVLMSIGMWLDHLDHKSKEDTNDH